MNNCGAGATVISQCKLQVEPREAEKKPRRLLALQYNYSDSEDEETRDERKARIVSAACNCLSKQLQFSGTTMLLQRNYTEFGWRTP